MKPPPFRYHRPGTVPEALAVLAEVGPRGKVLAGGQSLVPLLNMRLAAPAHLVDVNWLAELDEVATDAAAVRVSALSEPVLRVGCCGRFGARYDADAHLPCSAVPLAADRPGSSLPRSAVRGEVERLIRESVMTAA
jgi:hypothetical protein